ncbi:MAG: type B 50S ribosomal protein L31 [Phycisphaerales bacterium]|nr:MAG: type B 50S ribosomal protein L31 [Phycisphaerales bacterium]
MKRDIHPEYREVVFHDVGADFMFLTRSTVKTDKTIEYEGKKYPLVTLEISSASHPFYTGQQKFVDSMGRVDRFTRKYGGEYFTKPPEKQKPKFKKRI